MRLPFLPTFVCGMALSAFSFCADITLDQVMSEQDKKNIGISKLSPEQKKALETWINSKFELKKVTTEKVVFLSENLDGGKRLRLTNGDLYEVAPQDQVHTGLWITPFPIKIEPNKDPVYSFNLTNQYSGTTVKARKIEGK